MFLVLSLEVEMMTKFLVDKVCLEYIQKDKFLKRQKTTSACTKFSSRKTLKNQFHTKPNGGIHNWSDGIEYINQNFQKPKKTTHTIHQNFGVINSTIRSCLRVAGVIVDHQWHQVK